jgi:hypothetical protein
LPSTINQYFNYTCKTRKNTINYENILKHIWTKEKAVDFINFCILRVGPSKAKECLNITIWQKLDLLDDAMSDPYIEVCSRSHIGCTQRAAPKNEDILLSLKGPLLSNLKIRSGSHKFNAVQEIFYILYTYHTQLLTPLFQ